MKEVIPERGKHKCKKAKSGHHDVHKYLPTILYCISQFGYTSNGFTPVNLQPKAYNCGSAVVVHRATGHSVSTCEEDGQESE